MKQDTDLEIKLDAQGRVDVEYYVNQAHQMRGDVMAEGAKQLKSWIAGHLNLNWLKGSFARLAHH